MKIGEQDTTPSALRHRTASTETMPFFARCAKLNLIRNANPMVGMKFGLARHCSLCLENLLKIVLSRKGFDSASGGVPNPILPGGVLVPLPIPAIRDPHTYNEIAVNGVGLGTLVEELTRGKIERTRRCHLDPDLDAGSLPRAVGWRPA